MIDQGRAFSAYPTILPSGRHLSMFLAGWTLPLFMKLCESWLPVPIVPSRISFGVLLPVRLGRSPPLFTTKALFAHFNLSIIDLLTKSVQLQECPQFGFRNLERCRNPFRLQVLALIARPTKTGSVFGFSVGLTAWAPT